MRGAKTSRLIEALSEGPKTPGQLATITGLSLQGVQRALRKLRKEKRVRRTLNLLDMRERVYLFTEARTT